MPCPPRRQRHFHSNADRAYNTLHFALQSRVPNGALPPLETPTRKGDILPIHGAHTAFSCYPALRLYRLSKSQRGNSVVSLSKRIPAFPIRYRLKADSHPVCQFHLRHITVSAQLGNVLSNLSHVQHNNSSLSCMRHSSSFLLWFPCFISHYTNDTVKRKQDVLESGYSVDSSCA